MQDSERIIDQVNAKIAEIQFTNPDVSPVLNRVRTAATTLDGTPLYNTDALLTSTLSQYNDTLYIKNKRDSAQTLSEETKPFVSTVPESSTESSDYNHGNPPVKGGSSSTADDYSNAGAVLDLRGMAKLIGDSVGDRLDPKTVEVLAHKARSFDAMGNANGALDTDKEIQAFRETGAYKKLSDAEKSSVDAALGLPERKIVDRGLDAVKGFWNSISSPFAPSP
jgi:hypothetical protein